MKVLVIIPTYNEAENITSVIQQVFEEVKAAHILVVDDSSPDGTATLVQETIAKRETQNLFLLERPNKEGLGKAYLSGFQWALARQYDYIFEMDADLSHNPKELPPMLALLKENKADLVIGSRYVSGINVVNWPLSRIILSYGASFYVRLITGMRIKDPTAGFVGYKSAVLKTILKYPLHFVGYAFQIEMKYKAWKSGFALKEHPIVFQNREKGASKMNSSIIFESIYGVIYLKFAYLFKRKL